MESLAEHLEAMRRRARTLAQRAAAALEPSNELDEAFAELATALEELQSAEDQMRLQNTELVRAHAALNSERQRYRDLFAFAPDGYLVTDRRGVIHEANEAAAALFETTEVLLNGLPLIVLIAPDDRSSFADALAGMTMRATPYRIAGWEIRIKSRRGGLVPVSVTVAGVPREEGRPEALHWLLRDITDLKQRERLAAIGQMVAGLAHESRNALQRSQACLEMLTLEVRDRPRAIDLLTRLQCAQDDLHRLYEEVQQYAAPLRLDLKPCRLSALWREAWQQLAHHRAGHQVALIEAIGCSDECQADGFRLIQVFRNLLDNALAAVGDSGQITITCVAAMLGRREALRTTLANNGPSLTPEAKERLFEPFFTTKLHGTGLGLAVVRRMVEAHGGQIDVENVKEGGVQFILLLPRGTV